MDKKTTKKEALIPETDIQNGKPATFLVNARYELPKFGGIPYPSNISLFSFVTFRITEAKAGEGLSEKVVLKEAITQVEAVGHKPTGLVIESFSQLPEGWKK